MMNLSKKLTESYGENMNNSIHSKLVFISVDISHVYFNKNTLIGCATEYNLAYISYFSFADISVLFLYFEILSCQF
jgi:hypothetical protein